ncbi:glycosyltransferase [Rhodopirellula maiorica SM1]|uniref:Glycosyltransferase n=1 Tax=Rhodopirellula maiorica SM1 TaxID=1265738 RepID=M5RQF3_9BACT|nr:glycosyl transferase [Rhodopirellula maiorica]EMI17617.1 glycosyltransferase [Rhodopirellula maiorica SM1]
MKSRIVFSWEWGSGNGHLRRFVPLAESLQKRGHEIVLISREQSRAKKIFAHTSIPILPCPDLPTNRSQPFRSPQTYAGLAWNLGLHDSQAVIRSVAAWKQMLMQIQPTHMLSDFGLIGPMVANCLNIPTSRIGLGFGTPPSESVLEAMFGQTPTEEELSIAYRIESSLSLATHTSRLRSLSGWSEIFHTNGPVLLVTVADFDPYNGLRQHSEYLGAWSDETGVEPSWGNPGGTKAFSYLTPDSKIVGRCKELSRIGLNVLLVCGGAIPDGLHSIPRLTVTDQLLKTGSCKDACSLVICNANHGLTLRSLELGLPVLMFPRYIEHRWNTSVVQRLGFGVDLSARSPDEWPSAVLGLVGDKELQQRLAQYADVLRSQNQSSLTACVNELISWIEG